MAMSDRIAWLRQQSLAAKPCLSSERAELLTEFYRQETRILSAPVRRALAFKYLLEHKAIWTKKAPFLRLLPLIRSCAATA